MSTDLVHLWSHCHGCGAAPILGRRWVCTTCPIGPGTELCAACHERFTRGDLEHPSATGMGAALPSSTPHNFREAAPGKSIDDALPWLEVCDAHGPDKHSPEAAASAPTVPDGLVVRLEFTTDLVSALGSYGVAAEVDGYRFILTAVHVMDEVLRAHEIDLDADNPSVTGRELPSVVRSLRLYDVFAAQWIFAELGELTGSPMRILPEARVHEEEPCCQNDLAAFRADSPGIRIATAPLAARCPKVGEPVWLAARTKDGGRTLAATVVESTERSLIFRDHDSTRRTPYTSGAPLLNARGEIVGINIGAGTLRGAGFGHACHAESIRRHLAAR